MDNWVPTRAWFFGSPGGLGSSGKDPGKSAGLIPGNPPGTGKGWLACQFFTQVNNFFLPKPSEIDEYYKNNPFQDKGYDVQDDRKLNLHFGLWGDIQVPNEGLSLSEPVRTIPAAHAYASLQVPGCLLAV